MDITLGKRRKFRFTSALKGFSILCAVGTIGALALIIGFVFVKGAPYLSLNFIFGKNSYLTGITISAPIVQTLKLILVTIVLATPLGLGAAIYLVEYTKRTGKVSTFVVKTIRVFTETLAGVPSIVFGLFGMGLFVVGMKLGTGVWAGAFTLSLMVLPTIISTVEESLRAVPDNLREASLGLGASKLRTIFLVVLPSALSGIISAIILSIGRIVSESACVMFTAGSSFNMSGEFNSSGASLAVAMYFMALEGKYVGETYATGIVLIVIVAVINLAAAYAGKKLKKG